MTKTNKNTELPSGWEMKRFDEIISRAVLGGNYENSESNIGIPVIKMGNIDRGKINIDKIQYLPFESEFNKNDILKKGDLLFNTRNTLDLVGKVSVWNDELPQALYNSNLLKLEFKKQDVESNFYMNYVFNSHDILGQLKARATGTTSVAAIYGRDLNSVKFLLPPLPEQRAIANILSTWDTAIQTTQALISQKEQEKKWLMQNLLTGKKRLTEFSGEWKEFKLSDIFERVTRKNVEENTNVVTISAQRGFVKQTDFFNKSVASGTLLNYFLVEKGEFCYNKSYSNGYPWGATKRLNDFEKAVVTTLYICFGIKDLQQTSGDYFEQFFGANHLDKGLTKIAHEGGRAHGLLNVTPSDFFNLKITVPSIEEQTAIAQVLQTADKEITLLKNKLEQQKLQKKGLMQVLLTGKVRVKEKSLFD